MDPIVITPLHFALLAVWCAVLLWVASRVRAAVPATGPLSSWSLSTGSDGDGGGRLTPEQEQARAEIVSPRMQAVVRRRLARLKVPTRDRDDLAQQATEEAMRSIARYDPSQSSAERWLNRILVHVAGHYHARFYTKRVELREELDEGTAPESSGAERRMMTEQARLLLLKEIAALHPSEQAILMGHDLGDLSMERVAELQNIPLSTAYKWRKRALNALRIALLQLHPRQG